MGKTKRANTQEQYYHKTNTETWKSPDHGQYIPTRHLGKEYQEHDIHYMGMEYNGHSPQKGAKQRLTQELRAKEKEETRKQIEDELNNEE